MLKVHFEQLQRYIKFELLTSYLRRTLTNQKAQRNVVAVVLGMCRSRVGNKLEQIVEVMCIDVHRNEQ